jgi:N-hydroxyarylamine O-acetyltransferase
VGGEWRTLYTFDLQETFMPDYEMFNWFYASHPESPFVRGVIAARPVAGKRLALRNTRYSVHVTAQGTQTRMLATVADLRNVIEQDFGIVLSWNPALQAKLQAMVDAEATPKAT